MREQLIKLKKAQHHISQEQGRKATKAELMAALDLTTKQWEQLRACGVKTSLASLDVKVLGEGSDKTLGEVLLADYDAERQMEYLLAQEEVRSRLSTLSEREQEVIRRRYGMGVDQPQTLTEIGDALQISRERVRQIEKAAMKNLKQQMMPSHRFG
jgi:RNA polymerase sigma factor (sigma-70 family)